MFLDDLDNLLLEYRLIEVFLKCSLTSTLIDSDFPLVKVKIPGVWNKKIVIDINLSDNVRLTKNSIILLRLLSENPEIRIIPINSDSRFKY